MKVYKICNVREGLNVSTYAPSEFRRDYKIGETTLPVSLTKLFALSDLEEAKRYFEFHPQKAKLFEAEATGAVPIKMLVEQVFELEALIECFKYQDIYPMVKTTDYKSIVGCDTITLIKEIENEQTVPV